MISASASTRHQPLLRFGLARGRKRSPGAGLSGSDVGAAELAVEHEVRREGDERDAGGLAGAAEQLGPDRVVGKALVELLAPPRQVRTKPAALMTAHGL